VRCLLLAFVICLLITGCAPRHPRRPGKIWRKAIAEGNAWTADRDVICFEYQVARWLIVRAVRAQELEEQLEQEK